MITHHPITRAGLALALCLAPSPPQAAPPRRTRAHPTRVTPPRARPSGTSPSPRRASSVSRQTSSTGATPGSVPAERSGPPDRDRRGHGARAPARRAARPRRVNVTSSLCRGSSGDSPEKGPTRCRPEDCRHGSHRPGRIAPRRDPRAARTRRGPDRALQGRRRGQRRGSRRGARRGRDHHRRGHRAVARPGVGDGVLHRLGAEPAASRRRGRGEADRPRLDHRHRQVPRRLQRGEGGAGADAARRPAPGPDRSRGPVPRVRRSAGRVDDPGWRRPRARDANAARGRPRRRRSARRRGRGAGDRERQDHRGRRPAGGASRRRGRGALRQPR